MQVDTLQGFAVIVLAAGGSSRMGGPNKLLQPISGLPLLAHTLATLAGLRPTQSIVVTGRDGEAITALARAHGTTPVHNEAFYDGLGTSLARGADAIEPGHRGVFVQLGDVPFVAAETFHALSASLDADTLRACDVFVPVYAGRRGHPVLFRSHLVAALAKLKGDEGARCVVATHNSCEVSVSDPNIIRDVDTMADLAAVSSRD